MMTLFLPILSLRVPAGTENTNRDMLHALVSNPICVRVAPRLSAYSGIIGLTTPRPSMATNMLSSSDCSALSIVHLHAVRVYLLIARVFVVGYNSVSFFYS